jgi:hypothetical protein
MIGEFLPDHLKSQAAQENSLQTWAFSPDMIRDFSRLSNERREILDQAAGDVAAWLAKNSENRDETATDQTATALAPLGLLSVVAFPGSVAADLAILETGTEIMNEPDRATAQKAKRRDYTLAA